VAFDPVVWFITPVHRRHFLTMICLEQRKRMIDALPFEAHAVIVGDDPQILHVAAQHGFDTVEMNNRWVGAKFNAGYRHAVENGATHCMPIGSDSWLHPDALRDAPWTEKGAFSSVGLSSVSADGLQRMDMTIRYPAGFGVGMFYPAWCLGDEPSDPRKQRGIDTSTWERCGKGRLRMTFLDLVPFSYVNFHSPDVQITDWKRLLAGHHMRSGFKRDRGLDALRDVYDADLLAAIEGYYSAHSIGIFLTGKRPEIESTQATPNVSGVTLQRARRLSGNPALNRLEDLSEEFRALL
jgi:hypothetical protein